MRPSEWVADTIAARNASRVTAPTGVDSRRTARDVRLSRSRSHVDRMDAMLESSRSVRPGVKR